MSKAGGQYCPVCRFWTADRKLLKCPTCGEEMRFHTGKVKKRTTIQRHEYRLHQLIGEIKQVHAEAVEASRVAVKHALNVGRKLCLAHRILARLRTKLKRKGVAAPTWKEWVEINLKFSIRTVYYYMELHKNRKEVAEKLDSPRVSIRRLIGYLGRHLPEGDMEKGKGSGQKLTEQQYNLMELRAVFAEIIKKWDDDTVRYLASSGRTDLESRIGKLEADVRELAPLLLEPSEKGWDAKEGLLNYAPPRSSSRSRRMRWEAEADERAERLEAIRKEREDFLGKVWKTFKDRDNLTAWQREAIRQLVEAHSEGMDPFLRRRLANLTRDGEKTRNGRQVG